MLSNGKAAKSVTLKHCFSVFSSVEVVENLLLIAEQNGERNTNISVFTGLEIGEL